MARVDYMKWEDERNKVFLNKASMTKFPFPPLLRCTVSRCSVYLKVPVPAYQHSVKQFFKGSDKFSLELLQREKDLWHDDLFSPYQEGQRQEFKRLGNSLFVVLDPWYEALKGEQANSSSVGWRERLRRGVIVAFSTIV
jgi:hypothetical protein